MSPSATTVRHRPSEHDIASFRRDGFCVAHSLLSDDLVARCREAADDFANGVFEDDVPPHMVYPRADATTSLRKYDNAWWASRAIREVVTDPTLATWAAATLGVDAVRIWHDQLLDKPGGADPSATVGWHQDKAYWLSAGGTRMVTAWVAFDDVTDDMGPVLFVRGSHREMGAEKVSLGFFDGFDAQVDGDVVAMTMPAGSVSFHDCRTLHGSGPNTSDRRRRGLAVHYMAADTPIRRGRGHSNEALTDAPDGQPYRGPCFPVIDGSPIAVPAVPPSYLAASRELATEQSVTSSLFGTAWLWRAGRDDTRDPAVHPDHPLAVLRDLARLQERKPLGFNEHLVSFLESLPASDWSDHRGPLLALTDVVVDSAASYPHTEAAAALVARVEALLARHS